MKYLYIFFIVLVLFSCEDIVDPDIHNNQHIVIITHPIDNHTLTDSVLITCELEGFENFTFSELWINSSVSSYIDSNLPIEFHFSAQSYIIDTTLTFFVRAYENENEYYDSESISINIDKNLSVINGITKGDGYLVTDYAYADARIELFNQDILFAETLSNSEGLYSFSNIPKGNYQITISKDIYFGNSIFTSVPIVVLEDEIILDSLRINNVQDDYFPLSIGNKWVYDVYSFQVIEFGISERTRTYGVRKIEIISQSFQNNQIQYQFAGIDSFYLEIFDNVFDPNIVPDTTYLEEVNVLSGSFLNTNGFIISDPPCKSGFHAFVQFDELFIQTLGAYDITQGEDYYLNGQSYSTIQIRSGDYGLGTLLSPSIGMVKYGYAYFGNAVSYGSTSELKDFEIVH